MSCNCLGWSKFVITFIHQLYLHFYHHYLFLSHCWVVLINSSFISNIWQALFYKKIKDHEDTEPHEEDSFARERKAMRGQDYESFDSVGANRNYEDSAFDKSNRINLISGQAKLFLQTSTSFLLQFSKEILQLAIHIIEFLSHYSTKISLLLYYHLRSVLQGKYVVEEEYRDNEEKVKDSTQVEVRSSDWAQNVSRENLKNISFEAVNFTKRMNKLIFN